LIYFGIVYKEKEIATFVCSFAKIEPMLEGASVLIALWVLYRFALKDEISNEPTKEELKQRRKEEIERELESKHPILLKLWGLFWILVVVFLFFG